MVATVVASSSVGYRSFRRRVTRSIRRRSLRARPATAHGPAAALAPVGQPLPRRARGEGRPAPQLIDRRSTRPALGGPCHQRLLVHSGRIASALPQSSRLWEEGNFSIFAAIAQSASCHRAGVLPPCPYSA